MVRLKKANIIKALFAVATLLVCLNVISNQLNSPGNDDSGQDLERIDLLINKYNDKLQKEIVEQEKIKYEHKQELPIEDFEKAFPFHNERDVMFDSRHRVIHHRPDQAPKSINDWNADKSYQIEISSERINKLFDILYEKEKKYASVMKSLGILLFENLIGNAPDAALENFSKERSDFLKIVDSRVRITEKFLVHLYNLSDFYSFNNERDIITRRKIDKVFYF
jgi:hypothetical protein